MKIGLLAYHAACNMGATLQLLSSYGYWQKVGHQPIIINWVAKDLEDYYAAHTPELQYEALKAMRAKIWQETELCRNAEEVAHVIEQEKIEAVVIGSDAVAQNHPWITRLTIDKKRIITIPPYYTQDRSFPNPFWGTFNDYLTKPIPIAMLSASSQDSEYWLFSHRLRMQIAQRLESFSYVSTRDSWTQRMIKSITGNKVIPPITPDPVFGFNYNAGEIIPSREEITERYHLPEKYLLLSFKHGYTVSQTWLEQFEMLAKEKGYTCVMLPFADQLTFGQLSHTIEFPLTPLDWYALIKYSSGYIGHNMHPLIVAIHNNVPFFSFDNYGQRHLRGLIPNDKSSKILHILSIAGLEENRISCLKHGFIPPLPKYVLDKIINFNRQKEKEFADSYYIKYTEMMSNIQNSIQYA